MAAHDIRTALYEHKMTQREFGRRLGIDEFYTSKLVNGKKPLTPAMAIRIERVIPDLTAEDLLVAQARRQLANERARIRWQAEQDHKSRVISAALKHNRSQS